ncbi:MAG TPA: NrfD/PsrC family molybdoenzyme membrane anchor subunit [Ignavibacteriales bacterium]|nr:NrfD/PsrC family molybdoenzyme membrane anchor subunit [Ignavibacteriales bacterium]
MKLLTDGKAERSKFTLGRNIDPEIARLDGEGAQQEISGTKPHPGRKEYGVWDNLPSSSFDVEKTYYNLPMLKEPVWGWAIPAYLYVGGASGASSLLAAAAGVVSPRRLKRLIFRGRLVTLSGLVISTLLLVYDLGRKSRFLNMLRVFRPTSPMSMGSWILASSGAFTTASLIFNGRNRFLRKTSRVFGIGSGVSGIMLSGYTGVLLAYSAIPAWRETRRTLPILFIASGISGASSTLELTNLSRREDAVVHSFSVAGLIAELVAAKALEMEIKNYKHTEKTLHEGTPGFLWKVGRLMSAAALILALIPGRSKKKKTVTAVLESMGAMSMRFAIFKAGQVSARDPKAVFELQRGEKYLHKESAQKEMEKTAKEEPEATLEEMA